MDYSIEYIEDEIQELACEIREEVPYWMHKRPVIALRRALKKCQDMENIALDASVIMKNKEVILNCLKIFKK